LNAIAIYITRYEYIDSLTPKESIMANVINTNVSAISAARYSTMAEKALDRATQRLSSGLRVNSARDDAAGLAIATRMDSQLRGMKVAMRNTNDATSLVQVADSGLGTTTDILGRMRELAVQASNGSLGASDRTNLDAEYQSLSSEITRLAAQTTFNGLTVLGAAAGVQTFQVGHKVGDTFSVTTTALTTVAGDLTSAANANTAMGDIDTKLDTLNTQRATLGAAMNRLDYISNSLQIGVENTSAAKSRIMDADFASETAELSKQQILQQASMAMLAQSNARPQNILSLLR
jgi:flagellin